jgi:hypothetical protein
MDEINLTDFTTVISIVLVVYAILVVLNRRQFLLSSVNPNRGVWILVGWGLLVGGYSLLAWEAKSWDPRRTVPLLKLLFVEQKASAYVIGASSAVFLGLSFIALVVWCVGSLPRDPGSFRAGDFKKAVDYYTRFRGGLDYACLVSVETGEDDTAASPTVLAECAFKEQMTSTIARLPRHATVELQVEHWRKLALEIHAAMPRLDTLVAHGGQGENVRFIFDVRYGGFAFRYLQRATSGDPVTLFLFGATLDQQQMDTKKLDHHFDLLVVALRHILDQTRAR